jgi:hypothetical protein
MPLCGIRTLTGRFAIRLPKQSAATGVKNYV